jgi:hypothetical protein
MGKQKMCQPKISYVGLKNSKYRKQIQQAADGQKRKNRVSGRGEKRRGGLRAGKGVYWGERVGYEAGTH